MIQRLKKTRVAQIMGAVVGWGQGWLAPRLARQRTFRSAFIACLLAIVYWGVIASDRYVSEARVIIQRTDLAGGQSMDFGSLLTGAGGGSRTDQMLLRDYLLSVDMLNKLDASLKLREHFSDIHRDPLSRLWTKDVTIERLHSYFRSRASVEYDEYAGVLVIKAQAYDPEMAQAITAFMVMEGERFMNDMAHQLARGQVAFLEQQVATMSERANAARQALIALQNSKGMVSPQATAESLAQVVNQMEGQLTELRAKRAALSGYLAAGAPGMVELDLQISAIEQQMAREKSRLAAPNGKTLNSTVEEFQRLEMTAQFTHDVYKTALVALEKGRIEATRTLKKVSVLQRPTKPEYPLEPRRLYNIIVFILITIVLAGIVHLVAAIVRDHKD